MSLILLILFALITPISPACIAQDASASMLHNRFKSAQSQFYSEWATRSGLENLKILKDLQQQSNYEFYRNLTWIREYSKDSIKNIELENALILFLQAISEELVYTTENPLATIRIIHTLRSTALPIAHEITLFSLNFWNRNFMASNPQAGFADAMILLIEWHMLVENDYNYSWHAIAQQLANSSICRQSPTCRPRLKKLL